MYVLRYTTVAYTHVYSKDLTFAHWAKSNKKIQGLQEIETIEMPCKIPLTKIQNWTAGCELWSRPLVSRLWSVPWAAGHGPWAVGLLLAKPMVKHSGHLRTLKECTKHSPVAPVFYTSLVLSNACLVLSQCNTRIRLLYLLNIPTKFALTSQHLRDKLLYKFHQFPMHPPCYW